MAQVIDITNGQPAIQYRHDTPWGSSGETVSADATVEQWQEKAGLLWDVRKEQLFRSNDTETGEIDMKLVRNNVCLVRSDNDYPLSIVSPKYQVVQPKTLVEFFHQLKSDNLLSIETMGTSREGRVVWALGRTGRNFEVTPGDQVDEFVLIATSYDKSLSTVVIRTSLRVRCMNMLPMLLRTNDARVSRLRGSHLGTFDFEAARHMVQRTAEDELELHTFVEQVQTLAQHKMSHDELVSYLVGVLYPSEALQQAATPDVIAKNVSALLDIYANAPGQDMAQGTAWGALNAVTYYVDHVRGRSADRRFHAALFDVGAQMKKRAFGNALKLAA